MPRAVDIIIPVFGNFSDAARAIDAALSARNKTPAHVVIIDDASPQIDADAFFEPLRTRGLTLIRNTKNLGFVATVNLGMQLHDDRDVVLLNSDTLVFDGWLDRMAGVLAADPQAATVTPLSNAATILSYPHWLVDNREELEISWAQLDELCATFAASPQAIPTGVGFCMLIRREAIEAVGLFDAETFGQGYGEENDFCLRASRDGWVNYAAPNVFVWHRGGGSFGAERAAKCARAQKLIEARHPGYAAIIQRYIAAAPMRDIWMALDALRLQRSGKPTVLALGASTEPGDADVNILTLIPSGPFWRRRWRLTATGLGALPNLPAIDARASVADVRGLLKQMGIARVLVFSRPFGARAITALLLRAAESLGLPVTRRC